jgi:hypothetical protein
MAKYSPRENDTVLWKGHGSTRYSVMRVDATSETVDLQKLEPDAGVLSYDGRVPWSEIKIPRTKKV